MFIAIRSYTFDTGYYTITTTELPQVNPFQRPAQTGVVSDVDCEIYFVGSLVLKSPSAERRSAIFKRIIDDLNTKETFAKVARNICEVSSVACLTGVAIFPKRCAFPLLMTGAISLIGMLGFFLRREYICIQKNRAGIAKSQAPKDFVCQARNASATWEKIYNSRATDAPAHAIWMEKELWTFFRQHVDKAVAPITSSSSSLEMVLSQIEKDCTGQMLEYLLQHTKFLDQHSIQKIEEVKDLHLSYQNKLLPAISALTKIIEGHTKRANAAIEAEEIRDASLHQDVFEKVQDIKKELEDQILRECKAFMDTHQKDLASLQSNMVQIKRHAESVCGLRKKICA